MVNRSRPVTAGPRGKHPFTTCHAAFTVRGGPALFHPSDPGIVTVSSLRAMLAADGLAGWYRDVEDQFPTRLWEKEGGGLDRLAGIGQVGPVQPHDQRAPGDSEPQCLMVIRVPGMRTNLGMANPHADRGQSASHAGTGQWPVLRQENGRAVGEGHRLPRFAEGQRAGVAQILVAGADTQGVGVNRQPPGDRLWSRDLDVRPVLDTRGEPGLPDRVRNRQQHGQRDACLRGADEDADAFAPLQHAGVDQQFLAPLDRGRAGLVLASQLGPRRQLLTRGPFSFR